MPGPERIVIIGGGLAGASAAGALREQGYAGGLEILAEGSRRPYELPPLSKGVLLGDTDEPDWVHSEDFYAEHDIDLRLGVAASRVELGARLVLDAGGDEHPYERLLLATGSRPRVLPVPGGDLPGVRTLRGLDDSLALREEFKSAERVVIVGGGWIGTEAAAAARRHGANVTVVEQSSAPLSDVLGDEVARVFRDLHTENGVEWRFGSKVTEVLGNDSGVRGVRLAEGEEVAGDVVLVAVGASPRVELAHAAGLEIADDGGVSVDAALRSAAPDVYAVGDIAAQFHPRYGRRVRVEHWANAKNQGAHVAANLLGAHDPYLAVPYFFSDQYDLGCEYRGLADVDTDELVVRGDLSAREFIAFWLRRGVVTAAMNVNSWDYGDALKALVAAETQVTPEALRSADLNNLAP
ncbi:NAD(P)/FAD-dependent oxidoreductase [Amycolatopsis palatopharyngis]|uniref:NAD(P)/FAD-dependent oxidoreductase n=1 Tax=Amycolatopsis palatopharyngis TaxID=187982 RepID=UPI000E262F31|nr:FAD-dependent oxidoreductase [Amycolatopsis palatopharyngis]